MADDKRKFAVFDIDGTIYRYTLYHALVDELAANGSLPENAHKSYEQERTDWKNRTHSESFRKFTMAQVHLFEHHIPDLTPQQIQNAARAVLAKTSGHTYVYTRDLITQLKQEGYFLIAISGSMTEIAEPFAEHYGFDDVRATKYHFRNGKFTGKLTLHARDKHEVVEKMIAEHHLTLEGSLAIGDSMGDVSMLEMVDQAIAFNPELKLLEIARQQGWKIVVERKNVIYELNKGNNGYTLAKTN